MAKLFCDRHPDVFWFSYVEPHEPCFVCQPEAWPEPKQLDRQEVSVLDAVTEMVASGHWPPDHQN